MKKIITILCVFSLTLTLFGCGGKIRALENYSVGEYEGHWSVLYTDEKGVEEIAPLGDTAQPLAIEKGRIYFTEGSKLVSVDMDGKDRLETELAGMPAGTHIRMVDAEHFYCVADSADLTCWRVSKADQNDWAQVTIPRAFRPTDYAALEQAILSEIAAKEDAVRINAARITMDANGSVITMELDTLAYDNIIGGMKTWNTGRVTVRLTLDGAETDYTDLNVPVRVADKTLKGTLTLEEFLDAVSSANENLLPTGKMQGQAEGFRLMYLVPEYEACASGNKDTVPCVDLTGEDAKASDKTRHFVLAQLGGCDTMLTDSTGTACGNLHLIRID